MTSKAAIRREKKRARLEMDEIHRGNAARRVFEHLRHIREYTSAPKVAVYFPMAGELDSSAICSDLWLRRKRCFLPVLGPTPSVPMRFAEYRSNSIISANRFGIPEPRVAAGEQLFTRNLDLILLPLVAFDRSGSRLGMGGGYYDRALAYRNRENSSPKPRLFGLGYAHQEVDSLPSERWDVLLDGIITDQEIILIT
jgi:5-formyltetrahydrofolate cyclo-ligase